MSVELSPARWARAAESDLFLWQLATEKIGLDTGGAAQIISEFRRFREGRQPHEPV